MINTKSLQKSLYRLPGNLTAGKPCVKFTNRATKLSALGCLGRIYKSKASPMQDYINSGILKSQAAAQKAYLYF